MQEKQTSGFPGPYSKGNTNVDHPHNQATSNHTQPMQNPVARDSTEEAQGSYPPGQSRREKDHMQGQTRTQSIGSMSSAIPQQAKNGDHEDTYDKSRPETILLDLNAEPEVEEGEVQQGRDSCDLSLNLMLQVPQGPQTVAPWSGPTNVQMHAVSTVGSLRADLEENNNDLS